MSSTAHGDHTLPKVTAEHRARSKDESPSKDTCSASDQGCVKSPQKLNSGAGEIVQRVSGHALSSRVNPSHLRVPSLVRVSSEHRARSKPGAPPDVAQQQRSTLWTSSRHPSTLFPDSYFVGFKISQLGGDTAPVCGGGWSCCFFIPSELLHTHESFDLPWSLWLRTVLLPPRWAPHSAALLVDRLSRLPGCWRQSSCWLPSVTEQS